MILPPSSSVAVALLILAMVCWGCWINTFKAVGRWRFELYAFDFSFGAVLASFTVALTFGTLGFDGFSFVDDLLSASKKHEVGAILAGAVFNLGNMLLLAAVAECGAAVAFPIGMGAALVSAAIWAVLLRASANTVLLLAGSAIVLAAMAFALFAYRMYLFSKIDELVRTGQLKSTRKSVSVKGPWISVTGGLLIGCSTPIASFARAGDAAIGPYTLAALFALGILGTTFLYNLFFMNLPISGRPLEILEYFRRPLRPHLAGLAGGALWALGMAAALVASAAEGPASAGPAWSYGIPNLSLLLAACWGLFYWKEFPQADTRVRTIFFMALVLLACGIGLAASSLLGPPA